jgi:triphosphatase
MTDRFSLFPFYGTGYTLTRCHQTVTESEMPDTDATASARGGARAVAGFDGLYAPRDKQRVDDEAACATTQGLDQGIADRGIAEPAPREPAPANDVSHHERPQQSETAADVALPGGSATSGAEIELKLLVDANRLAELENAPIIVANARNKGTRRHLKSVYYDTPERMLWRNGLTLRVRQSGLRFTQTVKAEAGNDPLRRGEWEAAVASLAPDIALAMPFVPAKLRADLARQPLQAIFISDIRRHQRIIELPSGTVEIAFDQGFLKSGDRSLPVSEIELELKAGSAAAIYDLALRLAEHGRLRPSIRSKSARGFDLVDSASPAARRPRKLRLDASIALDDALAAILRSCLRHLLQSLPAAEDGRNPEGVHQLRVALRRLRAAFELMRMIGSPSRLESLQSDARWLAHSVSAARAWDIFQTETRPAVAEACPTIKGFDSLAATAEKHRSAAYRDVRHALDDPRCASFLIGLGGWIETRGWRGDVAPEGLGQLAEPAIDFAQRILSERHAKALKCGRHFKLLTAEKRHRLRLALKKLRYVGDFLLPLYEDRRAAKRFTRRLAALQEELGCYNDMATTEPLLAELGAESVESAIGAAAIAGWQAHAMIGVEPGLRSAWRDFTKARPPWSSEAEADSAKCQPNIPDQPGPS